LLDFFKKKEKESLSKVISRMTAKDGIQFAKFCTSEDLRRAITALGFKQPLPTSAWPPSGLQITLEYSLQRFSKLQSSIMKSLIDIKAATTFEQHEWELITNFYKKNSLQTVFLTFSNGIGDVREV